MSQVDEAVLDLTVSEASLLADVLGVAPPPGLVDPDDDVIAESQAAVAPGLVERRILDGEGTVAAPVADLLTVVGSPHLVARAVREVGGRAEIRSFAVRPEMAVEQRGLPSGLVRFTPFQPVQLADRIMAFVAPNPSNKFDDLVRPNRFECSADLIGDLFLVPLSDPSSLDDDGRVALMAADGVDSALARSFVEAVDSLEGTNSVTVLHRPAEQEIIGVDLTWLDAGSQGLWLTEPSERDPKRRIIERVERSELTEKLVQFLPFA